MFLALKGKLCVFIYIYLYTYEYTVHLYTKIERKKNVRFVAAAESNLYIFYKTFAQMLYLLIPLL